MDLDKDLEKRLNELEAENHALREWQRSMHAIISEMTGLLDHQQKATDEISKDLEKIRWFSQINRWRIESLPYELADPDWDLGFFKPHILTVEETRKSIIEGRRSIARLGDCEFAIMDGIQRWNYQKADPLLGEKLRQVVQAKEDGCLVGLNPRFYQNLMDIEERRSDAVRSYMRPAERKRHAALLNPDKWYADALFHQMSDVEDVHALKELWNNRDCVFVEGEYTRMGVGHDLFDNASSIVRILCPAENAFDRYNDILKEIRKQPKDRLILLALGPTATVLAYELFCDGYQAVDIGHMDLEYEKFRGGLKYASDLKIPYKYCNGDETGERREIEEVTDHKYKHQIIARIV